MKNLSKFLLGFGLLLYGSNSILAQSSLDEARKANEVKRLVNAGHYTFEAEKLVADKGKHEGLRTQGDLDISKDTLIAYLPDDGKSPSSPVRAMSTGFTCTKFTYNMTPGSNGGYVVKIQPDGKYAKEIGDVDMIITKEGYVKVTIKRGENKPLVVTGYIKEHAPDFPPVNRVAVQ
jgi:hypothetical protein